MTLPLRGNPDDGQAGSPPCVAPTWPEYVTDDWGCYWIRLDQEHVIREVVDLWDGPHMALHRHGRQVMVRDADLLEEGGICVADDGIEHDDAVVYARYEAYER